MRTSKLLAAGQRAGWGRAGFGLSMTILVFCVAAGCAGSASDSGPGGGSSNAAAGSAQSGAGAGAMSGTATGGAADATGGASGTGSGAAGGGLGGAFDVSSLFMPNGGPSACPVLAQTSCWQRLLQEYAVAAACFTHRSLCDATGNSGDASACGVWADSSHLACDWPDGTKVVHDAAANTDVIKNPMGAECYRKQFTSINGISAVIVTFDTRSYTISYEAASKTATYVCPDNTRATATDTEFQACNLRGICCSFPNPSCVGSSSL